MNAARPKRIQQSAINSPVACRLVKSKSLSKEEGQLKRLQRELRGLPPLLLESQQQRSTAAADITTTTITATANKKIVFDDDNTVKPNKKIVFDDEPSLPNKKIVSEENATEKIEPVEETKEIADSEKKEKSKRKIDEVDNDADESDKLAAAAAKEERGTAYSSDKFGENNSATSISDSNLFLNNYNHSNRDVENGFPYGHHHNGDKGVNNAMHGTTDKGSDDESEDEQAMLAFTSLNSTSSHNQELDNISKYPTNSTLKFDESLPNSTGRRNFTSNRTVSSTNFGFAAEDFEFLDDLLRAGESHSKQLLAQLLNDRQVEDVDLWTKVLVKCMKKISGISIDLTNGESFDISNYLKIKKIPGSTIQDSSVVDGMAFSKSLPLKSMPSEVRNPRIMIVTFQIEYEQEADRKFSSLEPLIAQQDEYLKKLVGRIVALKPNIVLANSSVNGYALQLLNEANIAVASNIKFQVLEKLSRLTKADIINSIDKLAMNPILGKCGNFEVKTYLHENSEIMIASRQWEQFWSSRKIAFFDPNFHQNIVTLFSMVSTKNATPCVGPDIQVIDFYWENDFCLGQFIEHICLHSNDMCSEGCGLPLREHFRSYVHGSGKVDVVLENNPRSIQGKENIIMSWSYCKICHNNTPVLPLSDNAWKYSFGKYLELSFWCRGMKVKGSSCTHDFYRDQIHYFSFQSLTVRVEYSKIQTLELVPPKFQLFWKPEHDMKIKIDTYAQVDSMTVDKMEAGQKRISELKQRVEIEHADMITLAKHIYDTVSVSDHLKLTAAIREVQDLSSDWNVEFQEFDKNFLPTEKDIKKITAFQLDRLFKTNYEPEPKSDDADNLESTGENDSDRKSLKPEISQPEKTSLLKSLTHFWADRSATLWEPLAYPLSSSEHIFVDSDVIVREDEPSSIIAFCLNTSDYSSKLNSQQQVQSQHEVPKMEESSKGNSTNSTDEKKVNGKSSTSADLGSGSLDLNLEQIMLKKGFHLKYQFEEGYSNISCKIFFAEQFDAFRKQCGVNLNFIESLSRCVKWDSTGGKSGSAFLKTLDSRFIIKELSRAELEAFVQFAPSYFEYFAQALFHNLPTVLVKIFGFYQIQVKTTIPGARSYTLDVLIMENLFYDRKMSRIFDLKGSMRNRHVEQTGKENEVLLDENMVEYIYESPLFVRENAKRLLRASLWNDTLFLAKMNVMDYSLVVGIDSESNELVVGIIDCIRTFTWDKKLESWVKEKGLVGGTGVGKEPTVITPKQYKNRFREAMERYILMAPGPFYQTGLISSRPYSDGDSNGNEIEMVELPPSIVDVQSSSELMLADIEVKINELGKLYKKNLLPGFNDTSEDEAKMNELTFKITKNFQLMYTEVKALDRLRFAKKSEMAMIENLKKNLALRTQELSTHFRKLQNSYIRYLKEDEFEAPPLTSSTNLASTSSSASASYNRTNDAAYLDDLETTDKIESYSRAALQESSQQLQQQQQLPQQTISDEYLQQREREIYKIAQGVIEISTIFKELETMVVDQGTILDRIDYNLNKTVQDVKGAQKQMKKAEGYQKSTAKCKIVLFLVLLILLLIMILIVKPKSENHYYHDGGDSNTGNSDVSSPNGDSSADDTTHVDLEKPDESYNDGSDVKESSDGSLQIGAPTIKNALI
ncbi:hypothetical protein CANARDRAFT_199346 [[Candida] arabinofermentans NRRL YB-2248]|uniref:1-phosphatidylinositol-3-phosphate 5-kinase n=1 Tax=[Candida] arabinofermentans NRRL YB-2248 TaxID=983967 RepID=A0A1E4T0R6_9ASCO|nr:hypothetical protein CANARDRAFT_199346 [[Candida] arabinofermentans NRRL YB-2248]